MPKPRCAPRPTRDRFTNIAWCKLLTTNGSAFDVGFRSFRRTYGRPPLPQNGLDQAMFP